MGPPWESGTMTVVTDTSPPGESQSRKQDQAGAYTRATATRFTFNTRSRSLGSNPTRKPRLPPLR